MDNILAKSGAGAPTLEKHTIDVMDAAEALFGKSDRPKRLGECWRRFFKISDVPWGRFHGTLLSACALHDWGKANDRMQEVLARKPRATQAIRHEHFSALLVAQAACWEWLAKRSDLDREVILSAVLTHHLKSGFDPAKRYGFGTAENAASGFQSLHRSDVFRQMLRETVCRLGLPVLDLSTVADRWAFDGMGTNIRDERERIKARILQPFRRDMESNAPRRRLLHAVRAALIAADAVGSGLTRTGKPITDWIVQTFEKEHPWTANDAETKIINRRIDDLNRQFADKGKPPFKWTDFQNDCADPTKVPSRALLLAPCGSGKTLAAWRWIASCLSEVPARHVLFLYPTRATATEGFRDYISWAPEADAALMHGTSEFDLDGMFDDESDPRHGLSYEADRRLFALGYWGRRAFSATVDQFLAFLQYGYGPVCMLPVLADSVIVIDEVHSFDRNMLAALKKFLTEFDVPVLCMTATLPRNRRNDLVNDCGLRPYEERRGDLKKIADSTRYQLKQAESREVADKAVQDALAAGKRVLWVVNQVKRAHAVIARFVKKLPNNAEATELMTGGDKPIPIYCYHSRFRLADRVDRHKALMRALKDISGPALGVTTQVCEMSLDIDVDLLITEDCPVTALVQRMGRCNRSQIPRALGATENQGTAGQVIVYKPEEDAPYKKEDLTGLDQFLALVAGKDLSQTHLEEAMQQVPCPPSLGDPLCSFLESGPYAVGGEVDFRDSEEFNRPCLLDKDVGDFLLPDPERKRQPGFVVPVPRKLARMRDNQNTNHAKLPGHLGVAADAHYHCAIGFCDRPLTEWGIE